MVPKLLGMIAQATIVTTTGRRVRMTTSTDKAIKHCCTRKAEIQDGAGPAKNFNTFGSGNFKNIRPTVLRKEIV